MSRTTSSTEMRLRRSCEETVLVRLTKTRLLRLTAMGRAFHLGDRALHASWDRTENSTDFPLLLSQAPLALTGSRAPEVSHRTRASWSPAALACPSLSFLCPSMHAWALHPNDKGAHSYLGRPASPCPSASKPLRKPTASEAIPVFHALCR